MGWRWGENRPMAAKVQQFHSGSRHTRPFFWCTHETKGRRVRKGRDRGATGRNFLLHHWEITFGRLFGQKKEAWGAKIPLQYCHIVALFYSYGCCCYLAGDPSLRVGRVDDLRTGRQSTVAAHCDRRQPAGLIIAYRPWFGTLSTFSNTLASAVSLIHSLLSRFHSSCTAPVLKLPLSARTNWLRHFPPAGCHFHISAQENKQFDEPLGRVSVFLGAGRNTRKWRKSATSFFFSFIYLFFATNFVGRVAATKSATGLGLLHFPNWSLHAHVPIRGNNQIALTTWSVSQPVGSRLFEKTFRKKKRNKMTRMFYL